MTRAARPLAAAAIAITVPAHAAVEVSALDGAVGFALHGQALDLAGQDVAAAGDFNGDGLDDLIIGAYAADPNGASSGQSYVVFGTYEALPAALELSDLDGTNGFALNGANIVERSGRSVAGVGDVNGDGIDDVVIGAFNAPPNGAASGRAYVVFGRAEGFPAAVELGDLDGLDGFAVNGAAPGDHLGAGVAGAGDLNGDLLADVVIGASDADPNGAESGAAYVIFGTAAGFAPVREVTNLDGSDGFAVLGTAPGDFAGLCVAGGDVNGDGLSDLILGARGADASGADSGAAYVIFGTRRGFPAAIDLSALDPGDGVIIAGPAPGAAAGFCVASAGDVNGDGVGDILVGCPEASPNGAASGAAYTVFGRKRLRGRIELAGLDAADGFALHGQVQADRTGSSVSGAGDLNNDGIADVVIGAAEADPAGQLSEAAYVIHGSDRDCNDNGAPDPLEVACGLAADANGNGSPDECDPDLDGDGVVAHADLMLLLDAWGPCPAPPDACPADLDGDGQVTTIDLLVLLAHWGRI